MRAFTKKTLVGVTGAAVLVGSAGAAYAYWTTSGSGDGSAATGTNTAVTVAQLDAGAEGGPAVGSDISGLVPGGTAKPISFRITNPASTPQYVTSVAVSIKNANGSTWTAQADANKPACTAADFTLVQPNTISADLSNGPHDYTSSGATIKLDDNTAANQDNCKGVTVPLHFAAS